MIDVPRLEDLGDLSGKSVLVRADFNVPISDGRITDDLRIRAAVPTLRYLLAAGASVTACTHLGRPNGEPDPVRPPIPPAELNDIAMQARFAEYLAEPRVLAVAREMLDTHLRIAQTACNKSRAPTGEAFTQEQLRRRGWHSGTCSSALFCVQRLKRSLCRRLAS